MRWRLILLLLRGRLFVLRGRVIGLLGLCIRMGRGGLIGSLVGLRCVLLCVRRVGTLGSRSSQS